jgi:hypothetical protein
VLFQLAYGSITHRSLHDQIVVSKLSSKPAELFMLGNDDGRIKFAFAKNPKKLAIWGGILKVKLAT